MCGIAGIVHADRARPVDEPTLRRMARAIRHRGPDGYGIASGDGVGLVSTRLAIFDIPSGWQPMQGAHRDTVMVYNGEVFNHYELRQELEAQGERFRTTSDTEILLRLLDRDGPSALERCNGQWGIAHLDRPTRTLTLMRDRFGVRPLHYALLPDGGIVFSSEVKGILASGLVDAAPDLEGIDEVFTFWAPRPPRCAFKGIRLLQPGHLLVWRDGEIVEERPWWEPRYAVDAPAPEPEALGELLRDSVRLRLRADVPVGCYLSGGLDSSLTTALAVEQTEHQLRTFSLAFRDPLFDESAFQRQVAEELGTQHHVIEIGPEEITDAFRDVMRHLETPVIRSRRRAALPAGAARRASRASRSWRRARAPTSCTGATTSSRKPRCARSARATPTPPGAPRCSTACTRTSPRRAAAAASRWRRFFLDAGPADDPLFSHQTRIAATSGVKSLYSGDTRAALAGVDPLERLRDDLPEEFGRMSVLERAAYLELTTLLGNHLLAAQADRVGMAHGIEGRFPFLDHRVFEHSVATRPQDKLAGLHEKIAVRRVAAEVVPPIVAQRPKQPYRAPEAAAFFADEPEWVTERLSREAVRAVGIYDERAVAGPRAALPRRPRDGLPREHGPDGRALDAGLARDVLRRRPCGSPRRATSRACGSSWNYPYGWGAPPNPGGGTTRRSRTMVSGGLRGSGAPEHEGARVSVRDELYDYISENFLYLQPDLELSDEDRFLELGVIDSTGVVELVGEVEERYGITVEDAEITEENFGSLAGLVRFVTSKRPAAV